MNNELNPINHNQFHTISPLSNVVEYVSVFNQFIEYKKVVEQEETKRLDIKSQTAKDLTIISGKLDLMEKKLIADKEDLRKFVNGTMEAIPKLIELGQFDLIDKLHERVANNLQGRVSRVAETFNQSNPGKDIYLLEDNEKRGI